MVSGLWYCGNWTTKRFVYRGKVSIREIWRYEGGFKALVDHRRATGTKSVWDASEKWLEVSYAADTRRVSNVSNASGNYRMSSLEADGLE